MVACYIKLSKVSENPEVSLAIEKLAVAFPINKDSWLGGYQIADSDDGQLVRRYNIQVQPTFVDFIILEYGGKNDSFSKTVIPAFVDSDGNHWIDYELLRLFYHVNKTVL